MKKLARDRWLDRILQDKSLSDTDVAALIQLYASLRPNTDRNMTRAPARFLAVPAKLAFTD